MLPPWTNWSGNVTCTPRIIAAPRSEAEISDLIGAAPQTNTTVRVTGTGHSFVPLCASDDLLLSLDNLQGIVSIDPIAQQATVWAGTKIHQLGDPLWDAGLAMANMGDIDRQSIAGAISTGTHGTGCTLGSISTQVVGLRIVTATGEIIECSPTRAPEIFRAAQVSLGALGVITQVTLQLLPAYYLHERTWAVSFEACMANLDALIAANRHCEFFWSPGEDACALKTLNLPHPPTPSPELKSGSGEGEQTKTPPLLKYTLPFQETGGEVTGRLARYIREERIDRSYRIFPSERTIKFNETEFAVPAANGPDCLRELRHLMQTQFPAVLWPIEYRTLAADEIDLSPACNRATVTISLHQAAELPYQSFFAAAEAIFRNHHGRPHWGKLHTHTAHDLRALYPQWSNFQAICARLDPRGMFMNEHLHSIFDGDDQT